MKKKGVIPKWLLILDLILALPCFLLAMFPFLIGFNVIVIILHLIRNKQRKRLVSDVAEGVAVGIQNKDNSEVNSASVQKMDLFGD